jgi:murein DD-endopeptidase MepM/ murein hydrolase activator NlpD
VVDITTTSVTLIYRNGRLELKRSGRRSVARRRAFVLVLFCVGVLLGSAVLFKLRTGPMPGADRGTTKTDSARRLPPSPANSSKAKEETLHEPSETPPAAALTTTVTESDLDYIASIDLLIPVADVIPIQLRDTFNQARSEGRRHDAIDIMAPQGTPVLAATDGRVIKLFQSDRGGITLYELDPSGRYVYYYAHLMSYAEGVAEGRQLRRGDVIAYVGDTGNAGAGKYHLHFAISKLTSPRSWSGGDPINPYPLFVDK